METDRKPFLNIEQQNAVYCTENTVVAAGAGSGKTMVLANRYSWLVTEKKMRVPEILTLTFTKKAAAQMYRRIHRELAEKAKEESGEKGRLAKQALEDFSLARIQTLDSYCASLVKQASNRYGISPDFAIDEERCHSLAFDESLSFLIANREHKAMQKLYLQKSPVYIAKNIFARALSGYTGIDIDLPADPKEDIKNQFAVICREWKKQTEIIHKKLGELTGVYTGNEKYHPDLEPVLERYNNGLAVFPEEKELAIFFAQLVNLPHEEASGWAESQPLRKAMLDTLEFMVWLKDLSLQKGSPRNNPAKDMIKELRSLFAGFSSLIVFCLHSGLIYSVLMLLSEIRRRYAEKKRAAGILSFGDVASLAKTILLQQQDIRQSEKETFRAIMIDEFQDNNELQKDLLFLLAEKENILGCSVPQAADLTLGKLFFVGDEKQSIYRFRGADVSVFRKLKSELGNTELSLKTNYRSAPRLIGAFNTIFGGHIFDGTGESPSAATSDSSPAVFMQDSPEMPSFEAAYTALTAGKNGSGKLTICILDKQDSQDGFEDESGSQMTELLSPVENEARYVAEKIKSLLDEKDENGLHRYNPDDIAILFRSRSPQHYFEKHLILLNIPHTSEDLSGFFYGGPVNDLMCVLRLVAYPTDMAAYAQMLRSPFAGLSVSGLTACLAVMDVESSDVDNPPPVPFGEEPVLHLCGDDIEKYRHGQNVYSKIADLSCRQSISSLISELWYGEGYRYETEWNPQTAPFRELYDYLFHLAVRAEGEIASKPMGLAAFTDYIQSLDKSGERLSDIEIPLERQGAVHLMTIHKSKGLEFPVVFLCCCDKKGRNDISDDVFETEYGLTLNPPLPSECEGIKDIKRNYFWERSLATEKEKRIAEMRRLLYVGMTRAEEELYLSGCLGISKCCGDEEENGETDFPLRLKKYVDVQAAKILEKNTGTQKGSGILDGDTFFGLCLPAFANGICAEKGLEESFFGIEEIPQYTEQHIRMTENHGLRFSNDGKGLASFLKEAEPYYSGANVLETPFVAKKHFSPTSAQLKALTEKSDGETLPGNFTVNREYSGGDAADVFATVDRLLARYAKNRNYDGEKFNSGSFGTIAHICVQALLDNREAAIPPKIAGFITVNEARHFLDAGNELAKRFVMSPLGTIAKGSKNIKSEFPFRSLVRINKSSFFINGVIDLVFEDAGAVHVVDFKTDSQEFPREHITQMACYHMAASDLFANPIKKKCRIWLYYLRSGHAVEVTEEAHGHYLQDT